MARSRIRAALLAGLAGALVGTTPAAAFDWNAVADERVPRIMTLDQDASERWTKLWIAVVDGQGYIRTGRSRWFRNIQRNPNVKLEIGGAVHPMRIEHVDDDALRRRVSGTMREKYGWQDVLIHPFGGPGANIMRLVPR